MNSWENEARFVLEKLKKDDELLFRDDDDNHTLHAEHDEFVKKWGFSYNDMWDLGKAIAMFILPRLAYYREQNDCIPGILRDDKDQDSLNKSFQKWDHILEVICDGLHLYIDKESTFFSEKEQKLWRKAKQYLFDYWEYLWY